MKTNKKTILLSVVLAVLTTVLLYVGGAVTAVATNTYKTDIWPMLSFCCFSALVLLGFISYLGSVLYAKSKNRMKLAETKDYMMSKKGSADSDPAVIRRRLKAVQIFMWAMLIAVLLLLSGGCFTLAGYLEMSSIAVLPVTVWIGLYIRLLSAKKAPDFQGYITEADYSELYRLAQSAADEVGVKGELHIALLPDCNAGIRRFGKKISLQMGTQLLSVLHPEEMYQILLHEFAHLKSESAAGAFADSFIWQFVSVDDENQMSDLVLKCFFRLPGVVAAFEFATCQMAGSESWEKIADSIIMEKGDPSMAVSALCKTAMSSFFDLEMPKYIPESFYAGEEPPQNSNSIVCAAFRKAIEERNEFWQALLEKELPYQLNTHPIFRQRREALGNPAYTVTLPSDEGAYAEDVRKARQQIDRETVERLKDSYAELRKDAYLEPLALVERYEASDGQITAPEIPPLLTAYRDLIRFEEYEALCDRILADPSLSEYETVAARFAKGCLLLSHYDAAGIDMINRAIELNHTYLEAGLEQIGDFCHRMGMEEEMEVYRSRVLSQMQEKIDVYDQAGDLSASDTLVTEDFGGDGRLPAMLDYMVKAGNGKLLAIYLVRKVITDDYFSSAFILHFDFGLSDDEKGEVYNKIYHYLDNYPMDWNYSLLVYDKEIAKAVKKVDGALVYHKE